MRRVSATSRTRSLALVTQLALRELRRDDRRNCKRREKRPGQRRDKCEDPDKRRRAAECVRPRQELLREIASERTFHRDARDHQAHRKRDQECGQRGDQRVPDREDRIACECIRRRKAVHESDRDPTEQIQENDQERCNRVAFDEFSGSVHGAVEICFRLYSRAAGARTLGFQDAGVHLGIDCHLLSRHRIERESRRDLGDTLRTCGNDDELNRDQDCEHDQSDDRASPDDERTEGRNNGARAARLVSVRRIQPRRRDVE